MKEKYSIDLNKPSERFLGWLPKKKASVVCFILILCYYCFGIFGWTKLPQIMVFGWWPLPYFAYCFFFTPVLILIICIYYYKFWPELKDEETRQADKDKEGQQ